MLDGHFQHAHSLRTLRLSTPLPNCPVNVDLAFIFFAQVSSAHLKQRATFPIKGIKSYKGGVIYIMPHLMLKQPEDIRAWSGHLPAFALLRLLKVSLSSFHITSYKNFIKHSLLQAHPPLSVTRLPSVKGSCKLAWVSSSARTHTSVFMGKLKTTILALDISSTTVHTDLCYYFSFGNILLLGFPMKASSAQAHEPTEIHSMLLLWCSNWIRFTRFSINLNSCCRNPVHRSESFMTLGREEEMSPVITAMSCHLKQNKKIVLLLKQQPYTEDLNGTACGTLCDF